MTTSNQNQHWVPKFLIKNFTDTDGRVFCLNIQNNEVTKPPPKHAASCVGFNDFLLGEETISFEERLGKIEAAAAPTLKQIVGSLSVVGMTETQRNRVADFMAAQSFRTESFYKGLELSLPRQGFGPIFAELWRSAFLLSAEIRRRKWVAMAIDHGDGFYLGDHPVVLQHTEKPPADEELGFDIQGVETYLPLAPKCALYIPCVSTSQLIISGYEKAIENIRNTEMAKGSQSIEDSELIKISEHLVQNSRPLYQSLTKGVTLRAAPENVDNLNYLQCVFAHRAIYSDRGKFDFARRVFRENPQYRNTVKVRLAPVVKRQVKGTNI
jgi:hypothetical protein